METDFDALTKQPGQVPQLTETQSAYGTMLLAGLLIFILTQFWYKATEVRHFAACTTFGDLRFDSALKGTRVFAIYLLYGLLLVLLFVGGGFLIVTIVAGVAMSGAGGGGIPPELAQSVGTMTGVGVVLLIFVIAGTLKPIIVHNRLFRVFCDTLTLQGSFSPDRLLQSQLNIPQRGEGLADALDVDAF